MKAPFARLPPGALARFRAVIFDFDGVIVDSEPMQARAWVQVARELGEHGREIVADQIAGRLDDEVARQLFPGCDSAWCAQRKAGIELELEAAGELRLVPGVEQLVRHLARTHLLGICSSCHPTVIARRLGRVGLAHAFHAVVGRLQTVPPKPAPDLYRRALAELRVAAHQACAIEDSAPGVAAAQAAGLHTIQLLHPGQPPTTGADQHICGF